MPRLLYDIFVLTGAVVFGTVFLSLLVGGTLDLISRYTTRPDDEEGEWPHVRAPHCPACGYNLRASPERCPECGKQVDAVQSTIVRYLMTLRGRQHD